MKLKLPKSNISDDSLEGVIENFHLGFAVAPAIVAIITTIIGIGKDSHLIIEMSFVIAVILFNFSLLWFKSKADEGKGLNLFYTFRTNNLLPVQSGERESYRVEIAVVEDKANSYFREDLKENFKKEFSLEELKNYLSSLPKLKNITWNEQELKKNSFKEKNLDLHLTLIDIDTSKSYTKDFKWLSDKLETVTAVVVVRTSELEKSDIYNAVNLWANQNRNSEIPILFAKNEDIEFSDVNEITEKFTPISDEPKPVPWRLLKKSKERGRAWRIQAKYNRAMVWNIFYLALMCVYIGAIWIMTQSKQYDNTRKGINDAIITEKQFRKFTDVKDDEKLNVSYWLSENGEPTLFVTTETPHSTFNLPNTKDYIIGCGFHFPNHVIEWKLENDLKDQTKKINTSNVIVYDNYDNPIQNHGCKMGLLKTNDAKAITCATFNENRSAKKNDPKTVGICVFTENDANKHFKHIIENESIKVNYRKFLRERTEKFKQDFLNNILSQKAISLEKIEQRIPSQ